MEEYVDSKEDEVKVNLSQLVGGCKEEPFLCGFTNNKLFKFYSEFQNNIEEEVRDDSSETCSLLDDIAMMNRD